MRFRLLQARVANDPVRWEERLAFANQLAVPTEAIICHDLLTGDGAIEPLIEGVDAVLVGGSGHFSVLDKDPWIGRFVDTLGGLAERQFPTFASCFGFQALVLALGGEVVHDEAHAEVGTYPITLTPDAALDPLFSSLPPVFAAQLGHKDRATVTPAGAVNLAASARCPVQAIRVGTNVYATQFHPELTGPNNRFRFQRYLDDYADVFGSDGARDMLARFVPSPEADRLLQGFCTTLLGGH